MRSARLVLALAVLALPLALARPAAAQCIYPNLVDDTPQVFTTTPQRPRFNQTAGRWAAVAVQSSGSANWDIGLSLATAPFPTCVSLPVVASQQASGVDFVLGDFAAEGTGLRYAPIQRVSGTGNASVEWDSGSRTASVGSGLNGGQSPPGLIDCWNVDLVAGTSYRIRLRSDQPGDYTLYAFKRAASTSWRSRSDALVTVVSNLSFVPVLTATTTDRYAFVVVRETATTIPYTFTIVPCVDPPHLDPHVSVPVPVVPGIVESAFQFEPAGGGFPTVAVRAGQVGDWYHLTVAKHVDPGFWPCEGQVQATSAVSGNRVELLVGDQVTGAVPPGGTYWLGTANSTNVEGRAEYSPGTDVLTIDGPTQYITGGPNLVVRTFRISLAGGVRYVIHAANYGPARGRLYVFRTWDPGFPGSNGWSALDGDHAPLQARSLESVDDFEFVPPMNGVYAIVVTNESAENCGFELGVSTCYPRIELVDRQPATIAADPQEPHHGVAYGTLHVRGGWSAVAVRPFALGEDWMVEAMDAPSGGGSVFTAPFACLAGSLGASFGNTSPVDFLARHENAAPLQERIETDHVYPTNLMSPGGGARVLYEQWNAILTMGDPIGPFPTSAADMIEVFNLDLVAGQPVSFLFDADGFAGEFFLFRPLSTCTGECPPEYAWPNSPGMEFRTSIGSVYTPPETATYGLIVVNQDGGTGKFWLAVNPTIVDAGPPPASGAVATRFRGATPNPVLGTAGARLEFELARAGRVGIDIVNLAGRVVAHVAEAPYAAGRGSVAWSPVGADGRRLAPGLYFARMRIDGEVVSARGKLTVLP